MIRDGPSCQNELFGRVVVDLRLLKLLSRPEYVFRFAGDCPAGMEYIAGANGGALGEGKH